MTQTELLKDIQDKVNILCSANAVWVNRGDIVLFNGKGDKWLQSFRDNNPLLWTGRNGRYLYNKKAIDGLNNQ